MRIFRIIGLAALLTVGAFSASAQVYYDMMELSGQSGYQSTIYETVTTADFLRAPANGVQRLAFTKGSAFTATVYACETKTYAAGTCTNVVTLSATDPSIKVTTGRMWLIVDVTAAETAGNVSYLTIRSHSTQQLSEDAGGGSGILGWPSLEGLGGAGRPTQALVVDLLNMQQWGNGAGRDANGSAWTGTIDAVDDFSYIGGALPATDGGLMAIGATSAAFNTVFAADTNDDEWRWMCRDNDSPFPHPTPAVYPRAGDVEVASFNQSIPLVFWDTSEDNYRLQNVDTSAGTFNCETGAGTMTVRSERVFDLTAEDEAQHFVLDGVHVGSLGGRFWAQRMLLASWMDQYPATLGVQNVFSDGYFESSCGALTFVGGAGDSATILPPVNTGHDGDDPIFGSACRWISMDNPSAATTAIIPALPGEYYTGQVTLNINGITGDDRSMTLAIRDNSGNNNSTVKFWLDGQATGGLIVAADDIDAGAPLNTAGQWNIRERMCYGGCTIKFAFQVEAGDTGFDLLFLTTDTHNITFDEMWARKKVFQDLNRHYLIADGNAEMKILTDSRGSLGSTGYIERFSGALDYMLGFDTPAGSRDSIRPNLHLTEAPSTIQFSRSGTALGDFVGANDGYLTYANAAIETNFENVIEQSNNYCVALFGINDQIAGNARKASASAASNLTNKHLYFVDQLRGFEIAAEKNGCIPIVLQDHMGRVNTNITSCHDADGSALNCGTWFEDTWVEALHVGIE